MVKRNRWPPMTPARRMEFIRRNTQKPCLACPKPRHFTSRYCRRHLKIRDKTGDPRGFMLRHVTCTRPWSRRARKFLNHYRRRNHAGVVAAEGFFADLLKTAERYPNATKLHGHLARLAKAKVRPSRMVDMAVGIVLCRQTEDPFLSDCHFRHQLAHSLLTMAQLEQTYLRDGRRATSAQPTYRTHKDLATLIIELLARFFVRVAAGWTKTQAEPPPTV